MDTTQEAEVQLEVEQPGLSQLREAVANRVASQLPGGAALRQDGLAGLNSAISSVPDGLASGILAGVNPLYGLYACMAGPIAGGIFSSSQLMVITTTSASALAAGQALAALPFGARTDALFVMVILVGAFQLLFGLLRMGRLTRFVSYSVMTGFLAGIAVLTVLSQLPTVTGYEATGASNIARTINLLANLGQVDLLALALSAFTLILAVALPRTALGNFGTLVAIVIPSLLVAFFSLDSVQIVRDVGEIPRGLPIPAWPSLSAITPGAVTGALAVAAIVLVQGAGVSQSVPNPDGSRRRASRDFIGQGAANVASGLFQGLPVGGSLGTTAINLLTGARSRWSVIFAGLWMALIVVAFPGLVSYVIMPALGALLILASVNTIKPSEVISIWNTGWASRLVSITTFLATLSLPIQAAVGLGVVFSALLYLNRSSSDIAIVQLVKRPDGRIEERRPPRQLPANEVTVLHVYGQLFYAGARTLERLLPRPQDTHSPVVVLRLRGHNTIGATLIEVLSNYANKLRAVNGRLYLSGMSQEAYDQVISTGKLRLTGPVRIYEATSIFGQSTQEAVTEARTWLVSLNEES